MSEFDITEAEDVEALWDEQAVEEWKSDVHHDVLDEKEAELSPEDSAANLVLAQISTPPGLTSARESDEELPSIGEVAEMSESEVSDVIESTALPEVEMVLTVARNIADVDKPINGMKMYQ